MTDLRYFEVFIIKMFFFIDYPARCSAPIRKIQLSP